MKFPDEIEQYHTCCPDGTIYWWLNRNWHDQRQFDRFQKLRKTFNKDDDLLQFLLLEGKIVL